MGYKKILVIILLSIIVVFALIFISKFIIIKYSENQIKDIVIITQDAIENKNPEKCKEIGDERTENACYVVVANATNDFSICSKIFWAHYPEYTYNCYTQGAVINNDESYCKKIEELVRAHNLNTTHYEVRLNFANCFTKLAIQRKDNSTCELISDYYDKYGSSEKRDCYETISNIK